MVEEHNRRSDASNPSANEVAKRGARRHWNNLGASVRLSSELMRMSHQLVRKVRKLRHSVRILDVMP